MIENLSVKVHRAISVDTAVMSSGKHLGSCKTLDKLDDPTLHNDKERGTRVKGLGKGRDEKRTHSRPDQADIACPMQALRQRSQRKPTIAPTAAAYR